MRGGTITVSCVVISSFHEQCLLCVLYHIDNELYCFHFKLYPELLRECYSQLKLLWIQQQKPDMSKNQPIFNQEWTEFEIWPRPRPRPSLEKWPSLAEAEAKAEYSVHS